MTKRRFVIAAREAGMRIDAVLREHLAVSWKVVNRLLVERRVIIGGRSCSDPRQRVQPGQRVHVAETEEASPNPSRKAKDGDDKRLDTSIIRHADDQIVVIDKPAGLTTMRHAEEAAEFGARGRRFLPETLADMLPALLRRFEAGKPRGKRSVRVRAVHRLDKETSGLVVFARTSEAESHLGKQFRAHTIERRYLALVRGRAKPARIESFLAEDRGDGRRGSTTEPGKGKRAVTHVRVVEALGEFSLVECRLETGRTHQVRIHLGEAGTPLCGERVYDRPLHGKPLPDPSGARRPMLHAATLGIDHPLTRRRVVWNAPLPRDMRQLQARLRKPMSQ
jgi:23S rRNA pseudouridine1911/1915/1917 synthase